jgi:RNA polymerase sigma factor (sigma-70 family)
MTSKPTEILPLEACWEQVLANDDRALKQIHAALYSPLLQYAETLLKDTGQADDVVQEIFIRAWALRKRIGPLQHVKAYFFTLLRRQVLNQIRDNKAGLRKMGILASQGPSIEFSAEDIIMKNEAETARREMVQQLLNQLPRRQKEVILLKYFHELGYPEIARIMRINYQSVINLAHKAIQFIKQSIAELVAAKKI